MKGQVPQRPLEGSQRQGRVWVPAAREDPVLTAARVCVGDLHGSVELCTLTGMLGAGASTAQGPYKGLGALL